MIYHDGHLRATTYEHRHAQEGCLPLMYDETQPLFSLDIEEGVTMDADSLATAPPLDVSTDLAENPVSTLVVGVVVGNSNQADIATRHASVLDHEQTYIAPVRRLNTVLQDVLDVDANPDRGPEEALAVLKSAMDTFNDETAGWLDIPSTPSQ
jgi:hypothetical protein